MFAFAAWFAVTGSALIGCADDKGTLRSPGTDSAPDGVTTDADADADADADSDSDSDADTDTVSTGDTSETTTGCPGGVFTGPLVIVAAEVTCDAFNVARFFVETEGETLGVPGGFVFSQETANAEPQWADTHSLESYDLDPCLAYDRLEREIEDVTHLVDPLSDWQTNVSSVFSCAGHYEAPVMTYAYAVNDPTNVIADCAVIGDDPNGLLSGAYNRVNEPLFDVSGCHPGFLAR